MTEAQLTAVRDAAAAFLAACEVPGSEPVTVTTLSALCRLEETIADLTAPLCHTCGLPIRSRHSMWSHTAGPEMRQYHASCMRETVVKEKAGGER
jgi:hypothetical protein